MRILLLIGFNLFITLSFGQTNNIDSLINITKNSAADTLRIKAYIKLYEEFEYSQTDTAIFFCKKALELSKNIKHKKYEAYSLYYLGGLYDTQGKYELAYKIYFKALKLFEQINNKKGLGGCFNCIGIVLWEQSEQATENVKLINLEKSLEYIKKGLKLYTDIDYKMGIGVCFMNNGIVYNDYAKLADNNQTKIKRFNLAIENYKYAIEVFKTIDDTRSISDCNLNIALLYYDIYFNEEDKILTTEEYNLIKEYLEKAKTNYIESNDLYGLAMALKNLATMKIQYSKTQNNKQALLKDAISDAENSLNYADSLNSLFLKYDAYFSLYNAHKELNDFKIALKYHELYLATKDTVLNNEKSEAIQEIETKYETQKKEIEIKELKIKDIKNESAKLIYLIVVGFLLFVSLIMIFFFRQKYKSNKLLNSKNQELKKLNATQNRLMSIISHDFKAPLSAFYSITSSLKNKIDVIEKNDIDEYLNRMQNSALGLKIQLENMLNWSISQSTKINVNKSNINLSVLVYKTVIILEEFAKEKGISIKSDVDDSIEIKTDSQLLSIVFNNLITNAIKFSNNNSIVKLVAKNINNKILISVKDTGIGISKDNIKTLFLGQENKPEQENKGTGLGLIVSKNIIEKLGGRIWVESELNIGTTFHIEL